VAVLAIVEGREKKSNDLGLSTKIIKSDYSERFVTAVSPDRVMKRENCWPNEGCYGPRRLMEGSYPTTPTRTRKAYT